MQKRATFDREFRLTAARPLARDDKPACEMARESGNKPNRLFKRHR